MNPDALSHRRVLRIALPIVLANVTVPLIGLVDTAVVGQLGLAAPIGAVGIGAIILSALYWIFGFLRMGTTGLTAQAFGAGRDREVRALLMRALLIGVGAGLLFVVFRHPFQIAALKIAPASADVEILAKTYLDIRLFSAPAVIGMYGITGWLIAQERTRAVLVLQLMANGLNIGLDLWFVVGLGWGVAGVATASVIGEWGGFLLGIWLCRKAFGAWIWHNSGAIFDAAALRRMAVVNVDIMIRSVLLQAAFLSFLFLGSAIDDVTLAANQVLMQFLHLTAYALDGFAFGAESLVGQAMGAGKPAALRRAALLCSRWGVAVVVALSAVFVAFGDFGIEVMTTSPEVRSAARQFQIWVIVAPLIGIASWMLDGIFIGATRTRDMRNAMMVATLVYGVAVWALLPLYGNHGLWGALMIYFIARAATLAVRYPALERAASGN